MPINQSFKKHSLSAGYFIENQANTNQKILF
jgi:hypothetical protein